MRKNLDISKEAVRAITIEAVNDGTVFKLKAEQILEDHARPAIISEKKKKIKSKYKSLNS